MNRPRLGQQLLLALAAAGGLSACGTTEPAVMLDVSLSLSDSLLQPPTPLALRVEATNFGIDPVEILDAGCPKHFIVRDQEGAVLGPEPVLCLLVALPPIRLAPGESKAFSYEWDGRSVSGHPAFVPGGSYLIQGWIRSVSGEKVFSDPVDLAVRSVVTGSR